MDNHIMEIQRIRAKNNSIWMEIMRLAFKHSTEDSKDLLRQIVENDKAITEICEKMINE